MRLSHIVQHTEGWAPLIKRCSLLSSGGRSHTHRLALNCDVTLGRKRIDEIPLLQYLYLPNTQNCKSSFPSS